MTNKYYNHDLIVVAQKLLQKFSPFLVTVAGEIIQFVPRQRFLIAIVNNEKVSDKVLIMFCMQLSDTSLQVNLLT